MSPFKNGKTADGPRLPGPTSAESHGEVAISHLGPAAIATTEPSGTVLVGRIKQGMREMSDLFLQLHKGFMIVQPP